MKQSKMLISGGRIIFNVVKEAIDKAGYSLQSKNPKTVLVWYDNLREGDFYSTLKPWQVVNRIPLVNLICRKAPFIQLMNRMKIFFPTLYTFYPESMILPACNAKLQNLLLNQNKKYIVKPDNGSLGSGITILSKNSTFNPFKHLSVAQEYIDSYLINDTKFDLRVYALISSISPLQIYVYHDGIARFCSEKTSVNNIFSQLTNTAVNRNNPNAKIESITKTISEVFHFLEQKGIDTNLIWSKIENAVILSILPVLTYMKFGVLQKGLSEGYNRCFQVLGFDFILDNDLNPYVLEVNYRPSLDADTEAERQLKVEMLGKAMHIGAPLENLQKIINENSEIANFSKEKWDIFYKKVTKNSALIDKNVDTGLFNLVYPSKSAANAETYKIVLNIANRCPRKLTPHYKLPVPLKKPDPSLLPKVNDIVFYSNNFEIDDYFKKEQNQQKSLNKNEIENNLIQNDQQKNIARIKLKNIENNYNFHDSLEKRLQSSVISNKQEGSNAYIKKLVQEIESMKELNSNEPKNNAILKNKQPIKPKNKSQKKTNSAKQKIVRSHDDVDKNQNRSNESAKQNESQKITINQDNAAKNQSQLNENAKQNETIEKVNASEEKLKIESHKQTLNQKQEENLNSNINETKEKVNEINYAKIDRSHRSASTKPISKRSVRAPSSIEHPNLDKDYQKIDDFSKKYFDLITKQLKKDINASQTKSSKTNIYNYSKVTSNSQSKALYEKTLIKSAESAKTPISNELVNKPKIYRHKSIENLRNNETVKTVNYSANQSVPEKQPQQKPPSNSTKQNPKENSGVNHKACVDIEEGKVDQKETLKIKLQSRASKNCQNPIEKVEPNKLQKTESKPKQETSTTTTTDTTPNQKIVIEPKQSADEKVKSKTKISDIRLLETEITPKSKKNDIEIKKNDVEVKAIKRESSLDFKAKQSEVKLNKNSDLETKEKAMHTVAKSNSELEKQKKIKTNQKLKRDINRLMKAEPKSKIENGKINSEIKKKVMKSEANTNQDLIELKDPFLYEEFELT